MKQTVTTVIVSEWDGTKWVKKTKTTTTVVDNRAAIVEGYPPYPYSPLYPRVWWGGTLTSTTSGKLISFNARSEDAA